MEPGNPNSGIRMWVLFFALLCFVTSVVGPEASSLRTSDYL
jgi:hypothetical protein